MFSSLISDSRSLLLLSVAIYLTLGAFLLLIWRTRRVQAGFGLWAWSDLMLGAALLVLLSREWLPPFPTAIVGSALLLAMPPMSEWALRKALDCDTPAARKAMLGSWSGCYLIWLASFVAGLSLQYRSVIIAAGMIALNLRVVVLLFQRARDSLPLQVVAAIYLLFAVLHLARGTRLLSLETIQYLSRDPWLNASLLVAALLMIARDMGFLCFTHARIEAELRDVQGELLRRANEDVLTGLGSRRYFEDTVPVMQAQARRQHLPQTLLLIDVDHFKAINDRFGHQAGDQVLITLAGVLRHIGRNGDLYARLGGDEFVLLLHDCSVDTAGVIGRRLTDAVAAQLRTPDGEPVSVSAGYTPLLPYESLQTSYPRADAALYAAKAAGRGRAIAAPPDGPAHAD
ncbi:GGDEF domain-containing protein [Jeongeupia chitinilytica]|uniref:diguanylate cyclase n=1 Tax=Jeongeupia chitinilytica TaxID=1041641 RepID=A0ABQ3H0A0_9NEIS|nr:sensor domain-containing diguanylate cyclase [Jeongeupia chitinilytica]GHD62418.1 GGDEF domain-containing protein [Jeongeupia chitinilytica]